MEILLDLGHGILNLLPVRGSLPMIFVLGVAQPSLEELVVHEFLIAIENQVPLLKAQENVSGLFLDPALPDDRAIFWLLKEVRHF